MAEYDDIFMEIGTKEKLDPQSRAVAVTAFKLARFAYPKAKLYIAVGGYGDDPRELYDIPEVREYIRLWAIDAGLSDWRDAIAIPWVDATPLGLLQLCGVFAADSPIKVNTPTGLWR